MIISRITGGLGNQLFQFAAAYEVAKRNQVPLKLHFYLDERDTPRMAEINQLVPALNWCSIEELEQFVPSTSMERLIQRLLPASKKSFFKERYFHFNPQLEKVAGNAYLQGYWQSENYFKRSAVELKELINEGLKRFSFSNSLQNKLQDPNSVSLHVRKGDYLKPPYSRYYHQLDNTYYTAAVNVLKKKYAQVNLMVFTDDPQWVESHLNVGHPFELISSKETFSVFEDMHAMTQCRQHIIANSSFSWWTAWLSNSPNKTVIAPSKWFNEGPSDTEDLIPSEWITV